MKFFIFLFPLLSQYFLLSVFAFSQYFHFFFWGSINHFDGRNRLFDQFLRSNLSPLIVLFCFLFFVFSIFNFHVIPISPSIWNKQHKFDPHL
jgi:hypothetical protein